MPIDWSAPRYEIELPDETFLSAERKKLLHGVEIKATVDGADELVMEATAWDGDARRYRFIDETILGQGTRVVVHAGYGDELAALQRFKLVREATHYVAGANPTVTIRGYSAEAELVDYTQARAFPGPISDSDIVKEIAASHGLTTTGLSIEPTEVRTNGRVKEKGQTDLKFLQQLAVANGFGPPIVRWDPDRRVDVLYWRGLDLALQGEIATFVHDPRGTDASTGSLRSFTPELSLAGVPTKVEVVGWDQEAQEAILVVLEITAAGQKSTVSTGAGNVEDIAEPVKSGAQLLVAVLEEGGAAEKREVLVAGSVQTTDDAVAWAQRWFETRQRAYMTARATMIGYHRLWVGQIHKIEGVAPKHEGHWEFLGVTHSFGDNGYTCGADLAYVLQEAAAPVQGS